MKRELEGEAIASRVDEIALLRAENVALKKQVAYLRSQRLTRLNEVKLAREYAKWLRWQLCDDCSIGRSLSFGMRYDRTPRNVFWSVPLSTLLWN